MVSKSKYRDRDFQNIVSDKLQQYFPYSEELAPGAFAFETSEPIDIVTIAPALAKRLSSWRFFKTQLTTSYEEYTFVRIIAAINTDNPDNIKILIAPDFQPHSPEFIQLFLGLQANSHEEREALARGIALLFETLTHEGYIEAIDTQEDLYCFKLYREGFNQNILAFEFNDCGELTKILVRNGSKTQQGNFLH
jgi:hypothetical protein